MDNILECQNVGYDYALGTQKISVLGDLNFTVGPGERVAILGKSGYGKSTLLNLLGGIDLATAGTVSLDGENLAALSEKNRTKLRARHLGFVFQFHHLLADFSALENVAIPLLIGADDKKTVLKKAEQMLFEMGLHDRLNHKPGELSGGERQRVAIARAMIKKPKCLLADEPTGNLDSAAAAGVVDALLAQNQKENAALVVVTHDAAVAEKMDSVKILEDGQLR